MTITKRSALVAILLGTLGVSACAMRSPNIADIQYNPGRYYNRNVEIHGVVSSSWGVPLVPFQVYQGQDSTGDGPGVAQSARVPPRGARVEVTGRVEEFGTFGGHSIGLHIRENHLRVRGRG